MFILLYIYGVANALGTAVNEHILKFTSSGASEQRYWLCQMQTFILYY